MNLILDYGLGNLTSIKRALNRIGADCHISSDAGDIEKADRIILPGVGHFAKGIEQMKERNFIHPLNAYALERKKPILGICLGMQLMTAYSEEGDKHGLDWINAKTVKIKSSMRIPHIGWNTLNFSKESILFPENDENAQFYFVHSYCIKSDNKEIIVSTSRYGEDSFISVFQNENIFGTQFHPEKSHKQGLQVLNHFLNYK